MLSVASLLNPAPSGPSVHRFPPSPASSASPTTSCADEPTFFDRPEMPKNKMAKDAAVFTKGKAKGVVNFYPFERLDDASIRETRKYQVFPLGKIQEYCRHIPYNSGKKDFFEKTRRESFEVFQYVFKIPGDEVEYAVMWDYNVGLVRMTPFFKCCKYSKASQTTPAKMLNLNPGLKEITHSITGGSIMAQGYWMPYQCAKAVCATFCHHIAGALIPIFGPDFPSQCIPPEAPEHGRMIIDPNIVIQSTREAEHFRRLYTNMVTSAGSTSPKRDRKVLRSPYDNSSHHPRPRIRRPFISSDSPYGTDTEGESSLAVDRRIPNRFHYASIPPLAPHRVANGWTPANMPSHHYESPSPSNWLSAVPRFASTQSYNQSHDHHSLPRSQPPPPPPPPPQGYPHHHHHYHHGHPHQHQHPHTYSAAAQHHWRQPKRSAEHIDAEYGYDGGESQTVTGPNTAVTTPLQDRASDTNLGAEKNAALLLMNLSVRDTSSRRGGRDGGGVASENTSPVDVAFPRVKRSRANSM
ncbi:hypothetical protein SUNI508_04789 [Seiridium unicorne]|uniref:HTH APSES-type domain-containing protein n=1 Tax=Seiridium unicorne TaxID=138068 RepID=A0ABR2V696_9PEZI